MDMETLLPVRLKSSSSDPCIGNTEEQLSGRHGFTKTVVHATAESIIKAQDFWGPDQNTVASAVDTSLLDFETYEAEVNSQYGRPVLRIIEEEGIEGYGALGDLAPTNCYLHAALHGVSVKKASKQLDVTPQMVIKVDDELKKIGAGYRTPDFISATIEVDGHHYTNDLREMIPKLGWVIDNWRTLGGDSTYAHKYKSNQTSEEELSDFVVGEADETVQIVVNKVDKGYTLHKITGVEEAVVADESDRYISQCGASFSVKKNPLLLSVDSDSIENKHACGNCL
jgi:hypothetical protein